MLDCKSDECRAATADAPHFLDHLCDPCAAHFARVRAGLDALGVAYAIDHRLVRGFDYYTRTTFEFAADALDAAQNGVGGGGRYDGLVELLGGDPTPGIGFGIGIERVLLACDAEGVFTTDVGRGGAPAARLRDRHRRRGVGRGAHGRAAPGRPAGRPGLRRALHEVPDQVGRPLGRPGGAGRRRPRSWPTGTVGLRPLRSDDEQRTVPRAAIVDELEAFLAERRSPDRRSTSTRTIAPPAHPTRPTRPTTDD